MGIVFFCQSCGARFEVDPRMAGKRGRCRKCGQYTVIPRAEEIASMSALPVVAAAAARGGAIAARAEAAAEAPSLGAWLKAGISQVGLAPLSSDRLPPPRAVLPSALDDAADSKPYGLARPLLEDRGPVRLQENAVVRVWRREIGGFQKVFRWLNESAYFVSIPFVMALLFATAVKNRPLALLAATFVVPLNLGRLAAGVANLVLVPLRDGLVARRYKKPVRRVVEPLLTIALVVLGFTFIPWLSGGRSRGGNLAGRVEAGARGLEKDIEGEAHDLLGKARKVDLDRFGAPVRRRLEGLVGKEGGDAGSSPTGPP